MVQRRGEERDGMDDNVYPSSRTPVASLTLSSEREIPS
jgi:hypothetical protein